MCLKTNEVCMNSVLGDTYGLCSLGPLCFAASLCVRVCVLGVGGRSLHAYSSYLMCRRGEN